MSRTPKPRIAVHTAPLHCASEAERFEREAAALGAGAVVCFSGLARASDAKGRAIAQMFIEHYPQMTERAIAAIAEQACQSFDVLALTALHRCGAIAPRDAIVFVACASRHRAQAFAACEFVMDYLKTRAPFWKKEFLAGARGGAQWVAARAEDDASRERWR